MRFVAGSRTDIGRARNRNEDSMLLNAPLFAVADGMGGHRGGDVASSIAVETLSEVAPTAEDGLRAVVDGIQLAHRRILERGQADRALRGMGTTVTAILTDDAKAHLAHVGDSRAYLFRDGHLQQLSEDHTLVQRMVREGKLSPEEANTHPQRSILTRALGVDEPVDVEQLTLDVHPGDRLLICSDGLSSMLDADEIKSTLERERDPQRAAEQLVEAANRAGGDDNITVIVLEVVDDDRGGDAHPNDGSNAGAAAAGAPQPSTGEALAVGESETAAARPRSNDEPLTAVLPASAREPGDDEPVGADEPRRHPVRRAIVWTVVVLAVLVAAIVVANAYVDHQWYVGNAGGHVAIYNGIPTKLLGHPLAHLVQNENDLPSDQVKRLRPYASLDDGITASSLAEARGVVDQMRRDLAAGGP